MNLSGRQGASPGIRQKKDWNCGTADQKRRVNEQKNHNNEAQAHYTASNGSNRNLKRVGESVESPKSINSKNALIKQETSRPLEEARYHNLDLYKCSYSRVL